MLLAVLLAATDPGPQALSLSASGGLVLSTKDTYEGADVASTAYLAGTRLQWDYAVQPGLFVGAVGGFEHLSQEPRENYPPGAEVLLAGAALGGRWGNTVRGGLRVAGGFARGFARFHYLRLPPAPELGGESGVKRVNSSGWFVDVEGELSVRPFDRVELFLDIPIVWSRTFYFTDADIPREKWWYSVPLAPLAATIGLRYAF